MIWKVNNLLYAAGPELVNTIRIGITLTEPVDEQALRLALSKAAQRYPYFAVRLSRRGEEYVMEPNDLPFVVSPDGNTVTLGSAESNFHIFTFAYEGCRIYLDTSHFFTDGNGMFPFLKTLLYYYLQTVHPDVALETGGIALAGSEIPAAEAEDDPYPPEPYPEQPLGTLARPAAVFQTNDQPQGYENADGWTSFRFRIRQKDMMAFVSSVDGSPATFIASLIYKAIADAHPETELPLVCGMQHQFRQALGAPLSHMCHVNIVPIVYPARLRGRDVEQLNTIARGSLILRADDANDLLTVNAHIRNEKRIRGMKLAEKHQYMRQVILDGIGVNTFDVSYTGRVPWSGLDRYISDVAPYFDLTLSGGLSVEIFSVGESFSINIMQRSPMTKYVERFSALLRECGVEYAAEPPEHFALCPFQLPE